MDCRSAEEDGEMGVFSTTCKIQIPYSYAFYTLVIVLGVLKEDLGSFFNTKGSFKDGFWRMFY